MSTRFWLLRRPAYGPADAPAAVTVSMPVILLAYVALQDDWVSRAHLATLFWPEAAEGSARRNLRRLISRLGEVPFASGVEVEADRLRWQVATDVHAFRQALGQGDWRLATDLYRGQLLHGFEPSSEGIAAWLELERTSLFAAFKDAAFERAVQLAAEGEFAAASALAARVLSEDPFAEEFVRLRMQSAFQDGHRFEALQAFSSFSTLLEQELGLEPEQATQALHEQIQGSTAPVDRLVSETRSPVPAALLRPPAQFAGRREELAQLAGNRDRPVLISGEPGIGKTRLLTALNPPDTLYCRCLEGLQLVPFHPLRNLIARRLDEGIALPDMGSWHDDFELLLPGSDHGEAGSGRSRLLEAAALYLERSGSMVLFDDLQWADTGTLELFSRLAHRGQLAVRGAYRASAVNPALSRTMAELPAALHIRLQPLDSDAMGELLAGLTGRQHPPEKFTDWLQQLTGGNPMFALETLRGLFEARILRSEDNDWRTTVDRFTRDYSELPAVPAVSEVVARRTERLSEHALRVLRAAAVLGDHSQPGRLAQVTALDEWQVLAAAEEANAAGLLSGTVFAHDLLREAVRNGTSQVIRSHLHREAARLFEEPLVQATHLAAAGDVSDAIPLWISAHGQLLLQGLYEEAFAVLDAIDEADAAGTWRMETLSRRAATSRGVSDLETAAELAGQVLAGTTDPVLRASALNTLAGVRLMQGDLSLTEKHARQGLEIIGPEHVLHIELTHLVVNSLYHQGRYDEAAEELVPIVERVRKDGPDMQLPSLLTSLGCIRSHQGQLEEALALHRESHRRSAELGQRHVQVDAMLNLLNTLCDLGRPEEGLELGEQGLALGNFLGTDGLRANLAAAYKEAGQTGRAISHYRELSETSPDPTLRCTAWCNLARFAHEAGDSAELTRCLDAARHDVQLTDFPFIRARVAAAVATFGTGDADLKLVRELLSGVDTTSLPDWLQRDLEQVAVHL